MTDVLAPVEKLLDDFLLAGCDHSNCPSDSCTGYVNAREAVRLLLDVARDALTGYEKTGLDGGDPLGLYSTELALLAFARQLEADRA